MASRYEKGLGQLYDILDSVNYSLPRFCYYCNKFAAGNAHRLKGALLEYRDELIQVWKEAIEFFRRCSISKIQHIFRSRRSNISVNVFYTLGRLRTRLQKRLEKLQTLVDWVDKEARVVRNEACEEAQQSRHKELLRRLPSIRSPMLLREGPFVGLPGVRNYAFYGRNSELQRLEDQLKPGYPPEELSVACLCGLGGVGKTQLALEFAYRFIDDFDAILWISAETSLKLEESYCSIAHNLGLASDEVQNANQLREMLKRWLLLNRRKGTSQDNHALSTTSNSTAAPSERATKWLLICDNVEDPDLLTPFWPSAAKGTIILTTRNPDAARYFTDAKSVLDISPFSMEDGQQFLINRVNRNRHTETTEQELTSVEYICQSVGYLPLALDIVGSYIASCDIPLPRFVETNRAFERDLLFDGSIGPFDRNSYQKSFNATWTLTNTLSKHGSISEKKSRTLIQMLAFLDPSGVPLSLFEKKKTEEM